LNIRSAFLVLTLLGLARSFLQAQPTDSIRFGKTVQLPSLIVKPGDNPANLIMEQVIDHKQKNNLGLLNTFHYSAYHKLEFDFHNYSEKLKRKKLIRPVRFVFSYEDSTDAGVKFVPFGFTETYTDVYESTSPPLHKELINASRISGIRDASFSRFFGDMYEQIPIYDNFLFIFDKNFISPVNDHFDRFYKYFLVDTVTIDSTRCFKLLFIPKHADDLTFMGSLYITDSTFAIKKIDVRLNDKANLNYLKQFQLVQDYSLIDGQYWVLTREQSTGDYSPLKTTASPGFYQRKTSYYSNFRFNQPLPDAMLTQRKTIAVSDSAGLHSETYWNQVRPDSLVSGEKNIYLMVDSLRNVKRLVNVRYLAQMFSTGYLHWKKIDLGPYYTFVSWNKIEGVRLKIGGVTSADFSESMEIRGMVAFGTLDKRIKSRVGIRWLFGNNPGKTNRVFTVSYRNDLEQLSLSPNSLLLDNILTSVLRKNPLTQVTNLEEAKVGLNYEWLRGFSTGFTAFNRRVVPLAEFKFQRQMPNGIQNLTNLTTTEMNIALRWALGEYRKTDALNRSRLPVFQVDAGMAVPDVLSSGYRYYRAKIRVSQRIRMGRFGYTDYLADVGKIWGTAPYLFLEVHQGSQTYAFDARGFNMMTIFEFVSDRFAYFFFDHHFEGFFLNKIPLLQRLKWREVITLKSVIGDMRTENRQELLYPGGADFQLHRPYIESGFAIENIFKFLRIDALWRMTHLDHPGIQKFGLRASLIFRF